MLAGGDFFFQKIPKNSNSNSKQVTYFIVLADPLQCSAVSDSNRPNENLFIKWSGDLVSICTVSLSNSIDVRCLEIYLPTFERAVGVTDWKR